MFREFFRSPDYPILILVLLIFLSFFFLIRGILIFLANPERFHQQRLKRRLREIDGLESDLNVSTLLKSASLEKSFFDRVMAKFSLVNRIQIIMLQANLKWELRTFLVVAALSGLVMAGLGLAKFGGWGALGGAGLGLIIPYKILVRRRKRRLKKFEQQLPDALDLLARGLKAGHAFPTGLQQVAKEMADPLGTEFFKTFTEFNHGLDLNTDFAQSLPAHRPAGFELFYHSRLDSAGNRRQPHPDSQRRSRSLFANDSSCAIRSAP